MLTVLVAAAPSLALLTYFYLRDRYEREPLAHVAAAYALGVFAMFAADGMSNVASGPISAEWLRGEGGRLFDEMAVAAAVSEVNMRLSVIERVRHHAVVAPFTIDNGLLTATQKVRRHLVREAHARVLERLKG